jgi:hypothetical protein
MICCVSRFRNHFRILHSTDSRHGKRLPYRSIFDVLSYSNFSLYGFLTSFEFKRFQFRMSIQKLCVIFLSFSRPLLGGLKLGYDHFLPHPYSSLIQSFNAF